MKIFLKIFAFSILIIFLLLSIFAEMLIEKITGFTPEEIHPHLIYQSVGVRDVPEIYQSYDGEKKWFEYIDMDRNKKIECRQLTSQIISCPEIEKLNTDFRNILVSKDFKPTPSFIEKTRYMRINSAVFVKKCDINNDFVIDIDEFRGAPKTKTFILGTDGLGRDIFSRLIYGLRISILIGLLSAFISCIIGITYGIVSGYCGGIVDAFMMKIVDVIYALPFIFIVILLLAVVGPSTFNLFIALALVQWLTMARIVRGQVLSVKERDYIEVAKAVGASHFRILIKHIIPNIIKPVLAYSIIIVTSVIKEESFLSFLGIGVQPPQSSLGILIAEGALRIEDAPHILIPPAILLFLLIFSLTIVGESY